jgi:hypothetical protein
VFGVVALATEGSNLPVVGSSANALRDDVVSIQLVNLVFGKFPEAVEAGESIPIVRLEFDPISLAQSISVV